MSVLDFVSKWESTADKQQSYNVDCRSGRAATEMQPAWEALASRALERNIYLEPAFALAAADHLATDSKPEFLFVSAGDGESSDARLIGVFPLTKSDRPDLFLAGWVPEQAAFGAPLLDRDKAGLALDLALAWMHQRYPNATGIGWSMLNRDGPVAHMIEERAAASGLASHWFDRGARAILTRWTDMDAMLCQTMSSKHRKYLRRGQRRLQELGTICYSSVSQPDALPDAIESFLDLEAGGWKGKSGTALKSTQEGSDFTREMLQQQAELGKCRIDILSVDDKPIAMGIVLTSGRKAFLWKIAYDEAYGDYSPGVQFMLEFSKRQANEKDLAVTDSCAIPDHPLFRRIWAEKMQVSDIFVALSPRRGRLFRAAIMFEAAKRSAREQIKSAYYAVSGRHRT